MIDLREYLVANMAATALGGSMSKLYTETEICWFCHGHGDGCPVCRGHGELPVNPVKPPEPDYEEILKQQGRA